MAELAIRKSASRLTAEEKSNLVTALLELKRLGHYDDMVRTHYEAMMERKIDPAHGGSAFLPWHRYCLRHLEYHLQTIDPSVMLPYWNWTRDRSATGAPWTDDLMGGNGRARDGRVMTGPFAYDTGNWPITVKDFPQENDFLTRTFDDLESLPTGQRINRTLEQVPYDVKPWNFRARPQDSFRANLEVGPHSWVHMLVGGNMVGAGSPNDPVFYLHHAMVDRLWAMWQKRHPTEPYKPRTGGPLGHNRDDRMWPWRTVEPPVTPKSVLDHHAMGYRYDDEESWPGPA